MNTKLLFLTLLVSVSKLIAEPTNNSEINFEKLSTSQAISKINSLKLENNTLELMKGANSSNPDVQIYSLDALKSVGDKSITPQLIDLLEKNNYVQIGSEDATIHLILKRKLLNLISYLSDSNYIVKNPDDTDEVKYLIIKMRQKND